MSNNTEALKERGMIFNAEMVRAILDGRKTQTRRVMAVQPEHSNLGLRRVVDSKNGVDNGKYFWSQSDATGWKARSKLFKCPFGMVGERIWVRETFNGFWLDDDVIQEIKDGISSAAELCDYRADYPDASRPAEGWTPSIHMPRWASRITLEITGVRVERLNSMTEHDALAEGCPGGHDSIPGYMYSATPHEHFHHIWTSIYGEDSWQSNPWVWVIEFKRVEASNE